MSGRETFTWSIGGDFPHEGGEKILSPRLKYSLWGKKENILAAGRKYSLPPEKF